MRRVIVWSALVLTLTALGSAGCSDPDVPPTQQDALILEAATATVDLDLTYPDNEVSVTLDVDVRYEPVDGSIFGGDYPVELSQLRLRDAAGGTAVALGTGTLQPIGDQTGVSAGQTTRLYYYADSTATASALAALCDVDAVEVAITVTMPGCSCADGTLTAPATLSCAEDRRATEQMALVSAGPPPGLPCTRASSATGFKDRYGYDSEGKLIFRDVYDGEDHQSRMVYYWDGDHPTAVETIDATDSELSSTLTYTWDEAGRLTRVESRSAWPPYNVSASLYSYEAGDALGWIRSREDGTETQRAHWDDVTDQLVVRDTEPVADPSATEVRATFSGDYVREAWLAYPEPLALASGKPINFSAAQLDGTAVWERTLVWDGDEVSSDTTTLIGGTQTGTITTTWDYCK